MYIRAAVNSHLWIDTKLLPMEVIGMIEQALMIDNRAKEVALKFHEPGAEDMDDFIELFEWEGDWLVLPRGFASQLAEGMESYGIEVRWQDERCRKTGFFGGDLIPVRPYQQKIINTVGETEQGIVKSPTGSGKTVAALALFQMLSGNALVIVNTKEIMQQWLDRIGQWLGEDYPVGLIGDNEFDISEGITVAIQASLWSKREQFEAEGFFKRFQAVCLDECHHATANTYRDIMDRFTAAWRFGMSATPEKTGDFRLASSIVGPIIVEVTEEDVEDEILKPEIEVIETSFKAAFSGNYEAVLQRLSRDRTRNHLIAAEVMANHRENANLILSKRIEHLANIWEALVDAGYPQEDILTIAGMDSRQERKEAILRTEKASCVVLSTLADEALDAPRLDRLHLAWPTANPELVVQQIGRIRRRHPDKEDAIVIDYRDFHVKPLNRQYMTRRHECYDVRGWTVRKRKASRV